MIYLDNASTTAIDPSVLNAMMPYLTEEYGNPGTIYTLGRHAAEAVDAARWQVADFIGAKTEQIVFTSGGTEANNLALRAALNGAPCPHVVTTAIEHDSIQNGLRAFLLGGGLNDSTVYPNGNGSVTVEEIRRVFNAPPDLVSVMYVNNETGAVNEVSEIGSLCRRHGVLFHTDCVQAAGTLSLDVNDLQCDFLSISSHKIHGPKGVGALFVRNRATLSPLIHGGAGQEFGLRGGTENVAGIVGFGAACELAKKNLQSSCAYTSTLKQLFWQRLSERLTAQGISDILHLNGPSVIHPGKILNIRFDGVDAETLVLILDGHGVYVSAGSACRSHEHEPSRVLLAMGLTAEEARNSIRVSFSEQNTQEETLRAADIMSDCVATLSTINE